MDDLKSFETLWEQGYRPFEIYTFNDSPVVYGGQVKPAGTVPGWNRLNSFFPPAKSLRLILFSTL